MLALDAAEAGSTQADATFGWIEDNVADYMGYSYDSTYAGPTAKAIIGAVAHGGDPTAFGGVDLIAELKATEGAVEPGRFSDLPVDCGAYVCDYSTTVSQSLALIALVRAGESPSTASADFLLEQQCSDGGFRSNMDADGCASDTDATAFAIQALIALGSGVTTPADQALAVDPQTASVDALDWLAAAQLDNGGFASDNDGANANSTAVSAQAFAAGGRDAELADAQAFIVTLQYGCSSPAVLRGGIAFSVAKRSTTKIADEDTRATPQSALALSGGSLLSVQRSEGASGSTVALPCTATPTTEPTTEPTSSDGPTEGSDGGVRPVDHRRRQCHRLARPDRHRPARAGAARPAARGRRRRGRVRLDPPSGGARLMRRPAQRILARLAGAVAASGLALAGLVVAAAPASAAACSGTSGVTVVVDTGSSTSTRCASGDPSSALKALTSAGFGVDYPQQFPGSVVCRINGYPSSDPCVRMPPEQTPTGRSSTPSAAAAGSTAPAAWRATTRPPAPSSASGSAPASSLASLLQHPQHLRRPARRPRPGPPRSPSPRRRRPSRRPRSDHAEEPEDPDPRRQHVVGRSDHGVRLTVRDTLTVRHTSPSATASASASPSPSATDTGSPSPSASATDLAAAPTSADAEDGGVGTLLTGVALVLLVAAGAGYAAWKRRA